MKPYFETKINLNNQEIAQYNKLVLEIFGSKQVKRSTFKYKHGSTHECRVCDISANSLMTLKKHKESHHAISFNSSMALVSSSTRNNSISETLLQENLGLANLSNQSSKAITAEETVLCDDLSQIKDSQSDCKAPIRCDWQPCDHESAEKNKTHWEIQGEREKRLRVKKFAMF